MIQSTVCRISLRCQALSTEGPDVKPGRVEPNLSGCNLTRLGINSDTLLYAEYPSDSCSCPVSGHAVGSFYTSHFLAATTTFPVQELLTWWCQQGRQTLHTQSILLRLELQTSLFCQIIFQKGCVVRRACSCWEASQKCSAGKRGSAQDLLKRRLRY